MRETRCFFHGFRCKKCAIVSFKDQEKTVCLPDGPPAGEKIQKSGIQPTDSRGVMSVLFNSIIKLNILKSHYRDKVRRINL